MSNSICVQSPELLCSSIRNTVSKLVLTLSGQYRNQNTCQLILHSQYCGQKHLLGQQTKAPTLFSLSHNKLLPCSSEILLDFYLTFASYVFVLIKSAYVPTTSATLPLCADDIFFIYAFPLHFHPVLIDASLNLHLVDFS